MIALIIKLHFKNILVVFIAQVLIPLMIYLVHKKEKNKTHKRTGENTMESYTNIRLTMGNEFDATEALAIIRTVLFTSQEGHPSELKRFFEDISVKGNVVIAEKSYTLFSNTYMTILPKIVKTVARNLSTANFILESWYISGNCGYEAKIEAQYENGTLTINSLEKDGNDYLTNSAEKIKIR